MKPIKRTEAFEFDEKLVMERLGLSGKHISYIDCNWVLDNDNRCRVVTVEVEV